MCKSIPLVISACFLCLGSACFLFEDPQGNDGGVVDGQDAAPPGALCAYCDWDSQCGVSGDICVANGDTGEQFCARNCLSSECPTGWVCLNLDSADGLTAQCVPSRGRCATVSCDGGCESGALCDDGRCVVDADYAEERLLCVDLINLLRFQLGLAPLAVSSELEACAAAAVKSDALSGTPHAYFQVTGGCGAVAREENMIASFDLDTYQSVQAVLEQGTMLMAAAGPGASGYDNIAGPWTRMACAVHVTDASKVWIVQQFQ